MAAGTPASHRGLGAARVADHRMSHMLRIRFATARTAKIWPLNSASAVGLLVLLLLAPTSVMAARKDPAPNSIQCNCNCRIPQLDATAAMSFAAPYGDPNQCGSIVGISCSIKDSRSGQNLSGTITQCSPNATLPPAPTTPFIKRDPNIGTR